VLVPLVVAAPPPPIVRAASIQDSPIAVTITPRSGTKRLTCGVDFARAKPCTRNAKFKISPGRHTVFVYAIDKRGHKSASRTVTVVVPRPAPPAIRVGAEPVGIAATDGAIWVSNSSAGTVSKIDTAGRRVVATVQVGGQLGGIATSNDGGTVWVSDYGGGSVVRIDAAKATVVQRIAVGGHPTSLIPHFLGPLWVGNLDGYVTHVDPATGISTRLTLPSGVSVLFGAQVLIWAGLQDGSVVAIDPATGAVTGAAVAVAPDVDAITTDSMNRLWVSTFAGTAALVDPDARKVKLRVKLPSRGSGISADGGGSCVWASAYDSGLVVQLDAATGALLGAVHTGAGPRESIAVGNTLWVVNQTDGTVMPITIGSGAFLGCVR